MKICSVCQNCYEEAATSCANNDQGKLVESRPGGRQISAKYRLNILLERGIAGETYQATDISANKSVVIRLIDPSLTGDLMLIRERLNTELRAAAEINHPNVVRVNDYGVLGSNEIFIATEMNGSELTLRDYLKDNGSLSEATAIAIARQAAEGLEAAHSVGIIHRSVSPANIFITLDGQEQPLIKLRNFDFGGLTQREVIDNASNAAPYLEAFRYYSPEQCSGQTVDARTDVYSLGVVLYEMLSGGLLFNEPTTAAITSKKNNGQLPPLNHLHFDVKALLTHTLMRSLNKRPDLRPPTSASFARNLRHLEYITRQFSSFGKKPSANQSVRKAVPSFEKSSSGVPTFAPPMLAPSVDNSMAEQESHLPVEQTPIIEAVTAPDKIVSPPVEEIVEPETLVSEPIVNSEPIRVQKKNITSELAPEPIRVERKNVSIPLLANGPVVSRTQDADVAVPVSRPTVASSTPFAESETEAFADSATLNHQNSFDVDEEYLQEPITKKRPLIVNTGLIAVLLAVAVLGVIAVAAMKSWQPQTEQTSVVAPTLNDETANVSTESTDPNLSKGGVVASTVDKRNVTISERGRKNEPRDDGAASSEKGKQNDAQPKAASGTVNEQSPNIETSKNNQLREAAKGGSPQAELGASLNKWIEATNSRDVNQQMNYYAPKMDSYYLARNASQEKVKAEKKRVFENAGVVNIQASKPDIVLSNDGQSARMLFHKKYVIKKGRQDRSGEVIQELQWVKSKNGWKIVSERDVKVVN